MDTALAATGEKDPGAAVDAFLDRLYAGAEARIESWLARLGAAATLRPLALEPAPPNGTKRVRVVFQGHSSRSGSSPASAGRNPQAS